MSSKYFALVNQGMVGSDRKRLVAIYTDKEKAHRECFYLKRLSQNKQLVVLPFDNDEEFSKHFKLSKEELEKIKAELSIDDEAVIN